MKVTGFHLHFNYSQRYGRRLRGRVPIKCWVRHSHMLGEKLFSSWTREWRKQSGGKKAAVDLWVNFKEGKWRLHCPKHTSSTWSPIQHGQLDIFLPWAEVPPHLSSDWENEDRDPREMWVNREEDLFKGDTSCARLLEIQNERGRWRLSTFHLLRYASEINIDAYRQKAVVLKNHPPLHLRITHYQTGPCAVV